MNNREIAIEKMRKDLAEALGDKEGDRAASAIVDAMHVYDMVGATLADTLSTLLVMMEAMGLPVSEVNVKINDHGDSTTASVQAGVQLMPDFAKFARTIALKAVGG